VEVPGKILVLGLSKDRMTLLTTIEEQAISGIMRNDGKGGDETSFMDQLNKIWCRSKGGLK
jgi:flagellar biogenesis protein FliO